MTEREMEGLSLLVIMLCLIFVTLYAFAVLWME